MPGEELKVKKRHLFSYLGIFIVMPLLTYIIGSWVDMTLNLPKFPPFPYNLLLGFSVFGTGLILGIKSTRLIYRLGGGLPWGELIADDESKRLVKSGLYAYTRNPMVLGYSILPCGMGIMFQSIGMATTISILVLVFNVILVKLKEEPKLVERFGQEYQDYKSMTPFLFPRIKDIILIFRRWREGYLACVILPLILVLFSAGLAYFYYSSTITMQNTVTTFVFILICSFGAIVAVYPKKASKFFRKKLLIDETGLGYSGHHPICGNFTTHIVSLSNKKYCAGCLGLALGALLAIFHSIITYTQGSLLAPGMTYWLGFALTFMGILQHVLDLDNAVLHTVLNVALVLGVSMIRVGVNELNGSLIADLYILCLSLYLVISRIELSEHDHILICGSCGDKGCQYSYC